NPQGSMPCGFMRVALSFFLLTPGPAYQFATAIRTDRTKCMYTAIILARTSAFRIRPGRWLTCYTRTQPIPRGARCSKLGAVSVPKQYPLLSEVRRLDSRRWIFPQARLQKPTERSPKRDSP